MLYVPERSRAIQDTFCIQETGLDLHKPLQQSTSPRASQGPYVTEPPKAPSTEEEEEEEEEEEKEARQGEQPGGGARYFQGRFEPQ